MDVIPLTVPQNNLAVWNMSIWYPDPNGGQTQNLTGMTLQFMIKPSEFSPDSEGTLYNPTITNALNGLATVSIPGTQHAVAETAWYWLDVVDGSNNHVTAACGNYQVLAK